MGSRRRARARVRMCRLGREAQRSRRERSLRPPRETLHDARADPRSDLKSLHCCSACDLQQISTMKAAVLLATAAHAAKQAVEEPAESPVACVPASLPN